MAYPRRISLQISVEQNGKITLEKVRELDPANETKVLQENNAPKALPADLGVQARGHNAIGVLVSNPTCFIVGGGMICI